GHLGSDHFALGAKFRIADRVVGLGWSGTLDYISLEDNEEAVVEKEGDGDDGEVDTTGMKTPVKMPPKIKAKVKAKIKARIKARTKAKNPSLVETEDEGAENVE
ncbi:hypothetical protein BGZ70_006032, partial [Mortierella alpina]